MEKALPPEEIPPREVLNGRYRFRTPLRCDGVGRLDCVADLQTGARKVVRWLPLEVNRSHNQNIVHFCANLPTHPSLPHIFEVGEMESWAYMVVDFPEGDLLAARKEFLQLEAWRNLACQLAGALNTYHAQQVFHGELCLASVMLLKTEWPLLWDMPLVLCSRMADRRQGDRALHQLVRTVSTMAPERARGGLLTPPMDVYSLGALLAYSAGAELPDSSSTLTLLHDIATGHFKPKPQDTLPPAYQNMLARMLQAEPSQRPGMREVEAFFAISLNIPSLTSSTSTTPSASTASTATASASANAPPTATPPAASLPSAASAVSSASSTPPAPAPAASAPPEKNIPRSSPMSARAPKQPPAAPTVSGVDWLRMLKTPPPGRVAAPKPEPQAEQKKE